MVRSRIKKKRNIDSNNILLKKKIAESVLSYLDNNSWSSLKIYEIIKKAKINKRQGINLIKSKKDILFLLNDYFDNKTLSDLKIEEISNQEKIFEILITRFEIYNEHRKAIKKLSNYILNKPDLVFIIFPLLLNSLSSVLEFSNISSDGIMGKIKVEGLFIIFLLTFLVWKKDESRDLNKTMAALDNYLRKADVLINMINKQ